MIEPDKILEEYNFWSKVSERTSELYLNTDGVMDTVVCAMCNVFHNALYGNDGKMKTDKQWHAHLVLAQKAYDSLKDLQLTDIDEVFFYKARAILWATAIVAGLDPHEVVDGKVPDVEEVPAGDITNITTEIM